MESHFSHPSVFCPDPPSFLMGNFSSHHATGEVGTQKQHQTSAWELLTLVSRFCHYWSNVE